MPSVPQYEPVAALVNNGIRWNVSCRLRNRGEEKENDNILRCLVLKAKLN